MRRLTLFLFTACLLLLSGCGGDRVSDEALEAAAGIANEVLEAAGGVVSQALEDLREADHPGGPFENNLDSARAYLLGQLEEKYGMEFVVVGDEDLVNYGPFAGASYSCKAAPADAPEQVTAALVSQTMYQDVRDGYAVYFFKEEAEAPVLALCGEKDYVLDQRLSLEMPETARTWRPEDGLETFLTESGAYVQTVLRFADGLDTETYAEYLYDFLHSVDGLECNLLLQAKANQEYLFHEELDILGDFDPSAYTVESLKEDIELFLSIGSPR